MQLSPRNKNTQDVSGQIRVKVYLLAHGDRAVKGNIVRSLTITNEKVSSVHEFIRRKIVDGEEQLTASDS